MKNNTIGKRIAEARINRNITQEHLEELSGLSVSTISRIETGIVHYVRLSIDRCTATTSEHRSMYSYVTSEHDRVSYVRLSIPSM